MTDDGLTIPFCEIQPSVKTGYSRDMTRKLNAPAHDNGFVRGYVCACVWERENALPTASSRSRPTYSHTHTLTDPQTRMPTHYVFILFKTDV